jgi:hypothetical protein|tara:strand:- start:624 stop:839 length:216 start_codon:yes stop_codon:yes gene_type:complete
MNIEYIFNDLKAFLKGEVYELEREAHKITQLMGSIEQIDKVRLLQGISSINDGIRKLNETIEDVKNANVDA